MVAESKKVLFVCTGNICRSAMAEQLLRRKALDRGLPYAARSCGMGAESWFTVPEPVRRLLAERGVQDLAHVPRLITREHLAWADIVLGMTRGHVTDMKSIFPEFRQRIALMRELAGFGREDVADPMNKSDEVFAKCCEIIDTSLDALIAREFK